MAQADKSTIEFRCSLCDQLLKVPDGTQGGTARCPKCSKQLRVPDVKPGQKAPPPKKSAKAQSGATDAVTAGAGQGFRRRPEQQGPESPTREPVAPPRMRKRKNPKAVKQFSIVSSLLLLVSMALPWYVYLDVLPEGASRIRIVTSWHLIASGDLIFIIAQISLWVLGLAAFIVALTAPPMGRSLTHICLGGLVALGVSTFVGILALFAGRPELLSLVFAGFIFIALLVLAHTRTTIGWGKGGKGLRIALGIAANLFLLIQLTVLIQMSINFSELTTKPMLVDVAPSSLKELPMALAALPLVLVAGMIVASGLMIFDAFRRKKNFTANGLILLYCTLFGLLIFLLVAVTMRAQDSRFVLLILNFTLMGVGCIGLLGTGVVSLTLELIDRKNRPPGEDANDQAAPPNLPVRPAASGPTSSDPVTLTPIAPPPPPPAAQ